MVATDERAHDVVREFIAAVNDERYEELREMFHDEYSTRNDNDCETVDEIIEKERERHDAFSDKREELDGVLNGETEFEGVALNAWQTVTGTHTGEFLNLPPSGHDVDFPLI